MNTDLPLWVLKSGLGNLLLLPPISAQSGFCLQEKEDVSTEGAEQESGDADARHGSSSY